MGKAETGKVANCGKPPKQNESKPKLGEVGRGEFIVTDLSIIQDGNAAALYKERYV
jgi:hypothetical protein